MNTFIKIVAMGLAVSACLTQESFAYAAEIKVLSSTAIRGVLIELGRQFESATGHKLVIE